MRISPSNILQYQINQWQRQVIEQAELTKIILSEAPKCHKPQNIQAHKTIARFKPEKQSQERFVFYLNNSLIEEIIQPLHVQSTQKMFCQRKI